MKQTELHLSEADRLALDAFRRNGVHPAREVNRAHVLMALDGDVADATICQVLGLSRTALWGTPGTPDYASGIDSREPEQSGCCLANNLRQRSHSTFEINAELVD